MKYLGQIKDNNDLVNKKYVDDSIPSALKNPNALTVQGDGSTSFTYDGSTAKTLNIKAGSNVSISSDTDGNITINSSCDVVDTHYTTHLYATNPLGTSNNTTTNGNTTLRIFDDTTARDNVSIRGTGATTVTSDIYGTITINSTDTNTTYLAGTGLSLSNNTFNHTNSIKAGTARGTSTSTIGFSGKITIPSITYDDQGHIKEVSSTTVTLPENPNTDYRVLQTDDTTDANYRVLLSTSDSNTNETDTVRKSNKITANPSTGELKATKMTINSHCTLEYDTTNECLNFNFS